MKISSTRVALSVALAAVLAASFAGPASAASDPRSLPAGDVLNAVTAYDTAYGADAQWYANLSNIGNSDDAVGSGIEGDDVAVTSPAWDAITSTAYVIYDDDEDEVSLKTVGVDGVYSTGIPFTSNGDDFYPDAIAISPTGAGFALSDGELYSLDLSTADATDIGESQNSIYALAFGSGSGALYGVDRNSGNIYTFDTSNGASTLIGSLDLNNEYAVAVQVDSAGILWIGVDYLNGNNWETKLASVNPVGSESDVTDSAIWQGPFAFESSNTYRASGLLLVPAPILPVIDSAATFSAVAGAAFSFTVTGTGTPAPTFVVGGTLPHGVSFDPATGILSGSAAAGTYALTFTATNAAGDSETQTFSLVIAAVATEVPAIVLPITAG